jgi:hypothetical protein
MNEEEWRMAYSLGDPYRPLRLMLRLNGSVLGFGFGLLLMLAPHAWLVGMGWSQGGAALPWRIGGIGLLTIGLFLLLGASSRNVDLSVLAPCLVFHTLLSVVLLVGYLRGDLTGLNAPGGLLLLIVFLLSLAGALVPLRYFGAEYRF